MEPVEAERVGELGYCSNFEIDRVPSRRVVSNVDLQILQVELHVAGKRRLQWRIARRGRHDAPRKRNHISCHDAISAAWIEALSARPSTAGGAAPSSIAFICSTGTSMSTLTRHFHIVATSLPPCSQPLGAPYIARSRYFIRS